MRTLPARKLAAAGTAGLGAAIAAAAYLTVGGLPGMLYAGGIFLAVLVGAVAILAGGRSAEAETHEPESEPVVAAERPRPSRRRRKKHIIAELEATAAELAATTTELEEHRHALANLAAQLTRESEAAARSAAQLEQRIRELQSERDGLLKVVTEERAWFEETLDALGGGIGRHGNELAELERELEALIAR